MAFGNQPLIFSKAPEPTDIIWENRFTDNNKQILKRELIAYGGIVLILVFSFIMIFMIAVASIKVL